MSRWGLSEAYLVAENDDVPIVVRRLLLRRIAERSPGLNGEVAGYLEMLAMLEDAYLTMSRETYLWWESN